MWLIQTGFKSWGRKWSILRKIIDWASIGTIIGMVLLLNRLVKIAHIDQVLRELIFVILILASAILLSILLIKFEEYSARKRKEEIAIKGGE